MGYTKFLPDDDSENNDDDLAITIFDIFFKTDELMNI